MFNALSDGTIFLGVANGFRGTEEGAAYFRDLVEGMRYKADHGIGTLMEEKYRLIFVGVLCYPVFRRFSELFTEWGGTFVGSTYLWFASGGANVGFQYDLARPLESLAELIDRYAADGVVFHPIKSCRTVSTGLADNRRALMAYRDVPTLFIESDLMDRRVVSEAQLKNRVDAFFEGLAPRKQQAAIRAQDPALHPDAGTGTRLGGEAGAAARDAQ